MSILGTTYVMYMKNEFAWGASCLPLTFAKCSFVNGEMDGYGTSKWEGFVELPVPLQVIIVCHVLMTWLLVYMLLLNVSLPSLLRVSCLWRLLVHYSKVSMLRASLVCCFLLWSQR